VAKRFRAIHGETNKRRRECEFEVIDGNLVEEDLAAGESNVEKNVRVGEEITVLQIRH